MAAAASTPVPAGGVLGLVSSQGGVGKPEPSSLSAFLVPGGQQPQYRPSGKPTITKVVLPSQHGTAAASGGLPATLGHEPVEGYLRGGPETNTASPRTSSAASNSSMDWYFKNYNRTDLEPYVEPLPELPSRGCAAQPKNTRESFTTIVALLVAVHLITLSR